MSTNIVTVSFVLCSENILHCLALDRCMFYVRVYDCVYTGLCHAKNSMDSVLLFGFIIRSLYHLVLFPVLANLHHPDSLLFIGSLRQPKSCLQ